MKNKITNIAFQYIYKCIQSMNYNFNKLFEEENACLYTFRILPEVCQQILLRIINFCDSKINISTDDLLFEDLELYNYISENNNNRDKLKSYLRILHQLSIIQIKMEHNRDFIIIDPNFKTRLKNILNYGIKQINPTLGKKKKNFQKMLHFGIKKLQGFIIDNLLRFENENFIIRSEDSNNRILDFLTKKKFLQKLNGVYKLHSNAINCILQGRNNQLRSLLGMYFLYYRDLLRNENYSNELINSKHLEFLKLIFQLCSYEICTSFTKLPKEYDQKHYYEQLSFLSEFGIIWEKHYEQKNETKYFCTPLIKSIFEDINLISPLSEIENNNGNFLIVETDFNVYAYTKNNLDIQIFELLFEEKYKFDGFIVGSITREKIRNILKRDIKIFTILEYLSNHSHPNSNYKCIIKGEQYKIPENVANQIVMWSDEINALNPENSILLYDFVDENQYDDYYRTLKQNDILWSDRSKKLIVVKKSAEEYIRRVFHN